jgi:hypothetical protein
VIRSDGLSEPHPDNDRRQHVVNLDATSEAIMTQGLFLSRRSLLRQAGSAAGAISVLSAEITPAAASKMSQTAVSYQTSPNGDHRCGTCKQFVAPNACKIVDGAISPRGWCRIWLKA